MAKYIFVVLITAYAFLALLSAAPADKKPDKKKILVGDDQGHNANSPGGQQKQQYRCKTCQAVGKECQSDRQIANCDKCYKFTGVPTDPKKVPDWVWAYLDNDAKAAMLANKGKETTVRGCATQEMIDVATLGETYDDTGCSAYPEFYGFKNVTACLCKGDCTKNDELTLNSKK